MLTGALHSTIATLERIESAFHRLALALESGVKSTGAAPALAVEPYPVLRTVRVSDEERGVLSFINTQGGEAKFSSIWRHCFPELSDSVVAKRLGRLHAKGAIERVKKGSYAIVSGVCWVGNE